MLIGGKRDSEERRREGKVGEVLRWRRIEKRGIVGGGDSL